MIKDLANSDNYFSANGNQKHSNYKTSNMNNNKVGSMRKANIQDGIDDRLDSDVFALEY